VGKDVYTVFKRSCKTRDIIFNDSMSIFLRRGSFLTNGGGMAGVSTGDNLGVTGAAGASSVAGDSASFCFFGSGMK
jgi:hypothetical protein